MVGQIIELFKENRAVRDFTVTGLLIVLGGVAAGNILAFSTKRGNDQLAATLPSPAKAQPGRESTHIVIRSVLDDDIQTGSIGKQMKGVTLDPCTGAKR